MRQHPDQEAVLGVIEPLLSRHVFHGWRVDGLHYDFLGRVYELVCTNGPVTVRVRLPTEWVDHALDSEDHFKSRRIKHALKDAFKIEFPPDENDD